MALLEVSELSGGYGAADVLHGVSLSVDEGSVVALIGANGAGKSTILRSILGLNKVRSGSVRFGGAELSGVSTKRIVAEGIALVPENRRVFGHQNVADNLRIGAYARKGAKPAEVEADARLMLERFPVLTGRERQLAGSMSGGQQQMLAIAMALMARPRLLMMDEPSLGLAPLIVEKVFEEIERLRSEGVTILLVEQLAQMALRHADRGVVIKGGHVMLEGDAADLLADPEVGAAYLGQVD